MRFINFIVDKQEIGVNLDKKVSKKQASTTPSVAVSSTIDDAISEDKKNISEINLLHDYCNILNKNVIYEVRQSFYSYLNSYNFDYFFILSSCKNPARHMLKNL